MVFLAWTGSNKQIYTNIKCLWALEIDMGGSNSCVSTIRIKVTPYWTCLSQLNKKTINRQKCVVPSASISLTPSLISYSQVLCPKGAKSVFRFLIIIIRLSMLMCTKCIGSLKCLEFENKKKTHTTLHIGSNKEMSINTTVKLPIPNSQQSIFSFYSFFFNYKTFLVEYTPPSPMLHST